MEFKGTKGEWELSQISEQAVCCSITSDDKGNFIDCWGHGVAGVTSDEMIANVKLIASAPDLLEALQSMLNIFDRNLFEGEVGYNVCEKAKQVIEKALKID
jgi:hypothetical protein